MSWRSSEWPFHGCRRLLERIVKIDKTLLNYNVSFFCKHGVYTDKDVDDKGRKARKKIKVDKKPDIDRDGDLWLSVTIVGHIPSGNRGTSAGNDGGQVQARSTSIANCITWVMMHSVDKFYFITSCSSRPGAPAELNLAMKQPTSQASETGLADVWRTRRNHEEELCYVMVA